MNSFKLATEIKMFDSVSEFVKIMDFSAKDLIVTNAPVYDPQLNGFALTCGFSRTVRCR